MRSALSTVFILCVIACTSLVAAAPADGEDSGIKQTGWKRGEDSGIKQAGWKRDDRGFVDVLLWCATQSLGVTLSIRVSDRCLNRATKCAPHTFKFDFQYAQCSVVERSRT